MNSNTIFSYKTYEMNEMSDSLYEKCAELYSQNYGYYAENAPRNKKAGDRVTMSSKFMKEHYGSIEGCKIVCAFLGNGLVGQAIYLRKSYSHIGTMTWVLQLVVKQEFRRKKIGTKLLHSIWGFSNDVAWGLATANPYTVRTLEAVTFRRVDPHYVLKHLDQVKAIANDIWFAKNADINVSETESFINTEFPVDNSRNKIDEPWRLGKLQNGVEWLAFTFKSQNVDPELFRLNYPRMIEFSEERLHDAYGRMRMSEHPWASGTESEVDYIVQLSQGKKIMDMGCGIGRHANELAKRGFEVVGIDYSGEHLNIAREQGTNAKFIEHDCRDKGYFRKRDIFEKFDVVLCLYDVVGSFPNPKDNYEIIRNAYRALRPGGQLLLSVMNYELTANCALHIVETIEDDPKALLNLKPSNTMQNTGDVFNAEYYLVEKSTHTVYRKEQFIDDGQIPAEYVIRDVRYEKNEIKDIVMRFGFSEVDLRYVSKGKWATPYTKGTDLHAKEILLSCRKVCTKSPIFAIMRRLIY